MATEALHTLFCVGNNQNFFNLPKSEIGPVWEATQEFLRSLRDRDGENVIGTMDDDAHIVGPSHSYPWTFYILADVRDQEIVKEACKLLRTILVGEFALWKYLKIDARMCRELVFRDDIKL